MTCSHKNCCITLLCNGLKRLVGISVFVNLAHCAPHGERLDGFKDGQDVLLSLAPCSRSMALSRNGISRLEKFCARKAIEPRSLFSLRGRMERRLG